MSGNGRGTEVVVAIVVGDGSGRFGGGRFWW